MDADTGLTYPNSPLMVVIDVLNLPLLDDGSPLWPWGKFVGSCQRREFEILRERGGAMAEAVSTLFGFSADELSRIEAERHELALMDQAVGLQWSRDEGRTEGRAEIILSLLRHGMPLADASRYTGLSEDEILNLAKDMKFVP